MEAQRFTSYLLAQRRSFELMNKLEKMTEALKADLPEFVSLVPPTERSEGLYRRVRHIQKTGECCGIKMSMQELKEIIRLSARESVRDAVLYLCRVLDRKHVQTTLKTALKRLNIDKRIKAMGHHVRIETEEQVKWLSCLISGRYSMDDLMTACEVAAKKRNPARYLLKMFKNGYKSPAVACYN